MKKILIVLLSLLPFNIMAATPGIVAIVNDKPITKYEFEARKKIVAIFSNADASDPKIEKQLNENVMNVLVEEEVIRQYSDKIGMKISDEDVTNAIATIEERNKMPKGHIVNVLSERNADVSSFKTQIRGELIKSNLLGSLSQGISVSPREVDNAVISSGFKDFKISAMIFTSNTNDDSSRKAMEKLRKSLKSCDKVSEKSYKEVASLEKIEKNLSKFDDKTKTIITDTDSGKVSSVYLDKDHFKMLLVCHKKAEGTSEDISRVKFFITNNKISKKAYKFLKDLKEKAYIQIF